MTNRDYRALPALIFVGAMLMLLMAQPAHAESGLVQCFSPSVAELSSALPDLTF